MLVVPMLLSACSSVSLPPLTNVQTELLEVVAQQPESTVGVIVQKTGVDNNVEAQVALLGGTVTQDLSIIQAFAAELPAQQVPALARVSGVRWVSLDSEVEQSSARDSTFYLYNSATSGDTAPSDILPMRMDPPLDKVLYNYDLGRDDRPGLMIQPGGTVNSPAGSNQVQRWRYGPFGYDAFWTGKSTLTFYAMAADGRKELNATVTAYLSRIDVNGNRIQVASDSLQNKWGEKLSGKQIRFSIPNITFTPGEYLEVALVVGSNAEGALSFAFGTKDRAAALEAIILDVLPLTDTFYMINDPLKPGQDTASHEILPLSYAEQTSDKLPNYDTDRNQEPGLTIKRRSTNTGEPKADEIQRWRLKFHKTNIQISTNAKLKFSAAMQGFEKDKYGKIWASLIDVDADGNAVKVIAKGFAENNNWGSGWKSVDIDFRNGTFVMPAGHSLEIAITVDPASTKDMLVGFGAKGTSGELQTNFYRLLPQAYLETIGATNAWARGFEGQGVGVAILDSGLWNNGVDFVENSLNGAKNRVVYNANVPYFKNSDDKFGHGTFIAGLVASNGSTSSGYYKGVAPQANLVSVRVSNEWGQARESDVVAGLQWVLANKELYNIRVVNMSLNSAVAQPYHGSPLDAASEILWFNGVVVVVAGGNSGRSQPGIVFPPANDPFLISVGSVDDMGTGNPADDVVPGWSTFGTTPAGIFKPDFAAPGAYIVSSLANESNFKGKFTDQKVAAYNREGKLQDGYFRASGTSVSAATVSGAVALLLQAMPGLNPDQVKYLLMASATVVPGEPAMGAGVINIDKAIQMAKSYGDASAVPAANTGLEPSQLLFSGSDPINWNSVNWNSVNWNSVNWNSVNWNSVNWNSVNWNSTGDGGMGINSIPTADPDQSMNVPLMLDDDLDLWAPVTAEEIEAQQPAEGKQFQQLYLPNIDR